jgi:hypothetical protein
MSYLVKFYLFFTIVFSFFSCEKFEWNQKNQFTLNDKEYIVDSCEAQYMGPSLMRVLFFSGNNKIEFQLSNCFVDQIPPGMYILDTDNYNYRATFFYDYGEAKLDSYSGNLNVIPRRWHDLELICNTEMLYESELTGHYVGDINISNKENTFLHNDDFFPIDTALVYFIEDGSTDFHEIYFINDFEDYFSPMIGFIMYADSQEVLSSEILNWGTQFGGVIFLNGEYGYYLSGGKLKMTFIESVTDKIKKYDFCFSIDFKARERVIGNFVGNIVIEDYYSKAVVDKRVRKLHEMNQSIRNKHFKELTYP